MDAEAALAELDRSAGFQFAADIFFLAGAAIPETQGRVPGLR